MTNSYSNWCRPFYNLLLMNLPSKSKTFTLKASVNSFTAVNARLFETSVLLLTISSCKVITPFAYCSSLCYIFRIIIVLYLKKRFRSLTMSTAFATFTNSQDNMHVRKNCFKCFLGRIWIRIKLVINVFNHWYKFDKS